MNPKKSTLLDRIQHWNSLWDIPSLPPSKVENTEPHNCGLPQPQPACDSILPASISPPLSSAAFKLLLDCFAYEFDGCSERLQRLTLSGRGFEQAKRELQERRLIRGVPFGLTLFLVPEAKLYELFSIAPHRLKRQLSPEHSFGIHLARHHVSQDPHVRRVDLEVALGDSGATVDMVASLKDGTRDGYEVTLSVGNVTGNAAKCQDKGFARIIFLCRDVQVRQAAWAGLRECGFPPDFLGRCRCMLFSTLIRRYKTARLLTSGQPSSRPSPKGEYKRR
jgi:hypothetical protein